MDELIIYKKTTDIFSDTVDIIEQTQKAAYKAVDQILIIRNWLLGFRIAEEELNGAVRAQYGEKQVEELSEKLQMKFGKGFSRRSLYEYLRFYRLFPEIVHLLNAQLDSYSENKIVRTVNAQFTIISWSYYRKLMQVEDPKARSWYQKETMEQGWSVVTLQRNISSQYYYRMLKTQDPKGSICF